MEVLFVIAFVWAIITLVGHGTWVLIRWIFTSLSAEPTFPNPDFSGSPGPPSEAIEPTPQEDLVGFNRMIDALASENHLPIEQGESLKRKAMEFTDNFGIQDATPTLSLDQPLPLSLPISLPVSLPVEDDDDSLDELEIIDVDPASTSSNAVLSKPSMEAAAPLQPNTPKQAFSEVVASFLAQHNIRWGELIAGILIVVCSIGLVLSLWSTLTSAHRIVPAVVFMSADAAIFAAGLYTMKRWKLRHTSRAVLIIATLLVPLCVLAGLAAAGADAESVSLTDPVTVGVVVVATLSCGWLLWHACVALIGRVTAAPMIASVVASSLTLPLLPAASRWLGLSAGWVVIVPALVTAFSFLIRYERCRPHGRRLWKNQWLHLGVAVSSFASVIAYAVFLLQPSGREIWIQIAIASIPVWTSIAMVFGSRAIRIGLPSSLNKAVATRRLIASVVALIAIGLIIAIVPASIEKVSWLWLHAIVAGLSIGIFGWWMNRLGWIVTATLPIGLVATMTSPVWLAGQTWSEIPLYRTILGGEPMIVAIGMLTIGITAMVMLRPRSKDSSSTATPSFTDRVILGSIGLWGTLVVGQSIVLSWAPASWLGMMPTQAVGGVLAVIILLTGWLATNQISTSLQRVLAMVASAAGVSLTTLIGGQEIWRIAAWRSSETLWILGGIFTLIGGVWLAIEFAIKSRSPIEPASTDESVTREFLATAAWLFGFATVWQAASIVTGPLAAELSQLSQLSQLGRLGRLGQWIRLPGTSLSTTAVQGVGLALLGSTCLVAHRFKPDGSYSKLISLVGTWVGLFVSVAVAINVTEIATWRLVTMTTLAYGALAAVQWKFPSQVIAGFLSGLVAIGSFVLLWASWWQPIQAGGSPDLWITVTMAVWWLVGSALLGKTQVDWKRVASAFVVALTFAMLTPAFFAVTPIVWFQATALGSLVWLVVDRCWHSSNADRLEADEAVRFSISWTRLIGFASVAGLFCGILMRASWAASWSLPIGWLMTLIAMGSFVVTPKQTKRAIAMQTLARLPLAIPIMSGHIACLGILAGWFTRDDLWLVVSICSLIGSIGSSICIWLKRSTIHSWHVSLQAGLIFALAVLQGGSFAWIALAALAVAAIALMRFDNSTHARSLSWLVILGGIYLILAGPSALRGEPLTWLMLWTGANVVLWRSERLLGSDSLNHQRGDMEAATLMIPMLGWGIAQSMDRVQWQSGLTFQTEIIHHCYQAAIALLASASGMFGLWGSSQRLKVDLDPNRLGSRALWKSSLWLITGSVVLTSITVATIFDSRGGVQWMVASVSSMSVIAVISWVASRHATNAIGLSIERVAMVLVGLGTLVGIGLSLESVWGNPSDEASATWARISILGLGILAWAIFGLAEQTRPATGVLATRRRDRSIMITLWTVALLAVFGGQTFAPETISQGMLASQPDRSIGMMSLVASMRLLIASILAIGLLVLVIPKLLAGPFVKRWQSSLRRGGSVAAVTATAAMVTMLVLEAFLRQRGFGVDGLPMPTVIVVGLMLATLAIMAGVIAVISGPGFELSRQAHWLQLPDRKRTGLLYASQGIGFLTWLHLFLCRTEIAHLGLRPYWPYIVMLLAFVSVGLTQWAIRRGDRVLADTMKRTAMFLPLVPVVGFWLSGSYATFFQAEDWSWTFYRGPTSYQGLLLVGAIYYGIMSFIWKNGFPRIASVVLANVGLWVMLTQTPGWHFLSHPQAWLIPPAVCVLLVAHFQRDKLDTKVGSAIRYAATLMIYLSSTADMLLSEIGSSLWGPIVLILIALAGMLAGVALRVKPFLYLGTIFTFLGVVSMVWHAGQAIDAVWPWWVFGITMGLILLTILAGIEKHRDQLQRWSERLATWS